MQRYSKAISLAGLASAFLICWSGASSGLGVDRLPDPLGTIRAFAGSAFQDPLIMAQGGGPDGYWPHALFTFRNATAGVLVGGSLGIFISLVAAQHRVALLFYDSFVEIVRVLPPLIFIPFTILVVNSSGHMELLAVALYSCLSMSVHTIGALLALPPEYAQIATLLGASRGRRTVSVELPGIAPSLAGPLRVNAALGAGICVVAEFLAAPQGIGRVMHFALSFYRVDLILAGVLWTVLCVFTIEVMISLIFAAFVHGTNGS